MAARALFLLAAIAGLCHANAQISLVWSSTLVGEVNMAPIVEVLVESSVDIYSIVLDVGYTFPDGSNSIGDLSLFPMIVDGEWESTFDSILFNAQTSTISGSSTLGQPIPAGSYSLLRFQFPTNAAGAEFCIKDTSEFFNQDLSISYEFEGPGCTTLSMPEARMEFRKPREVDGEIEVELRMDLSADLFGLEMGTAGPDDGVLGPTSLVNNYFDLFGNITKIVMFSFDQESIPAGVYDDFMLFRFPLTDEGETFCVLGDGETVMSGEGGSALVTTIPGCVALVPAPPDCEDAGSGDIVADGVLDVGDVIFAIQLLIGEFSELDDCSLAVLDANLDALNDVSDIVAIIQDIVGL